MKSGRGKSPWKRDIKIRETRRNKITRVSRIMKSRCDRKFEALIKHRPLFVVYKRLQKTRYNAYPVISLFIHIYIYTCIGRNRICDSSWKVSFNGGYEYLFHLFRSTFILYMHIYFLFPRFSWIKLILNTFERRVKVSTVYRKSIVYRTRIFEIMQITG